MGLRLKIGVTIAATAAMSAMLTGAVVPTIVQNHQRDAAIDSWQIAQSYRGPAALRIDLAKAPKALRDYFAGGGKRAVTSKDLVTYLEVGKSGTTVWAAGFGDDGKLVIVNRHYSHVLMEDLDRATREAAVVGALGASVVGLALAAAMVRRLRRSTRQAERIKDGELDARLPERGRDEIAQLAAAINMMAQALAARIEAERAVTANIAHELRTPVAGLLAASSLLAGDDRPAEMVRERAVRLRDLMEDVLEVARIDNGGERAEPREVELATLARRVVAGVRAERPQAAVTVEVVHDSVRETDPRRLDRILTNLVTNALRHGAEPVVVEVAGPELRVRDHGPGFPSELIAHGPQRFRTGGNGGLGLGLAIVTGQAAVIGARVSWHNPPEGGAVATITLPPDTPAQR